MGLDAGVTAFGENYVQELRTRSLRSPLRVALHRDAPDEHGPPRRRPGGRGGDRRRGAPRRLARRAARSGRPLDVLIEVDLTGERTGVAPDDVAASADRSRPRGLRLVA